MNIPPSANRRRHGFSLIEVTLALGIGALGLTSVLGLLPLSIGGMKKAGDMAADCHITEQIFGSIAQAQWQDAAGGDALGYSFNGRRYYFDAGAQELKTRSPGIELAYVAQVTVQPPGAALPGGDPDLNMRQITVRVTSSPLKDFDFDQVQKGSYHSHSALVTRTSR